MGDALVRALEDVDFQLGRGELVVLLGASGNGKSTLLNILGGLDTPTAGSVRLGEQSLELASDDELPNTGAAPSASCLSFTISSPA